MPEASAAAVVAFTVSVESVLPAPLAAKLAGLRVAVTPAGIPVTARAIVPANVPLAVVVTFRVDDWPRTTVSLATERLTASFGAACTVSATVVVATMPPLVPVIVIFDVPAGAAVDTVSVAVALPPALTLAGV